MTTSSSRTKQRRQAPQQPKRPPQRPAPRRPSNIAARTFEPVDYTKDYADVRRDLVRIGIWATLLFGAMIAGSFFV